LAADSEYFSVNTTTGELVQTKPVDYESNWFVQLVVESYDLGVPEQVSSCIVNVTVLDANDNTPQFSNASYDVSFSESILGSTPLLLLRASDRDQGDNARFTFSLDAPFSLYSSLFQLEPVSGVLSTAVNASFDFETGPHTITLQATVTDMGVPALSSQCQIVLNMSDFNDNAPTFFAPSYTVSVNEDIWDPAEARSVAVPALSLNVTDADGSVEHRHVSFTLISVQDDTSQELSRESWPFVINSTSGVLMVTSQLDYEAVQEYTLQVAAVNSESSLVISATATITVRVLDVNDNAPTLSAASSIDVVMLENVAVGTALLPVAVVVSDADSGRNGRVMLTVDQAQSTVNAVLATGGLSENQYRVQLDQELDYEAHQEHTLVLVATDDPDNSSRQLSTRITIRVFVVDVNDNGPIFGSRQDNYTVEVREDASVGSVVAQVSSSDADSSNQGYGQVTFGLASVEPTTSSLFAVDEASGVITVLNSTELDYESAPSYRLMLVATDSCNLSSEAAVVEASAVGAADYSCETYVTAQAMYVRLVDVNDNRPVFLEQELVNVSEAAEVGAVVAQLSVSDLDSGRNGQVEFQLVDSTFDFAVNNATGTVTVAEPLNREVTASYELIVSACDQGLELRLCQNATLAVNVVDVNDHAPAFNLTTASSLTLNVSELETVNSTLMYLTANDSDATAENRQVRFYLRTTGNEAGVFGLDDNGRLYLARALDYEVTTSYVLTAVVDNVAGQLASGAAAEQELVVTIDVVNENDNAPVFGEASYTFSIYENATVGSVVGTLAASDADLDLLVYSGNNSYATILMNGSLVLLSTVDFESASLSLLSAQVSDGTFYASTTITLSVEDSNDVIPDAFWNPAGAVVRLSEDMSIGQSVASCQFVDSDTAPNSASTFEILPGTPFSIDASTGATTLGSSLDYEQHASWDVVCVVTNTAPPYLQSNSTLMIEILDVNDNSPSCVLTNFTIFENSNPGTMVGVLQGIDIDSGSNAQVNYKMNTIPEHFNVSSNGTVSVLLVERVEQDPVSGPPRSIPAPLDREQLAQHSFSVSTTMLVLAIVFVSQSGAGGRF
jgi:hypothetical protein